jgi:hypothetical protein
MRKTFLIGVLGVGLLALPTKTEGYDVLTGDLLYDWCTGETRGDQAQCNRFVHGIVTAACLSDDMTYGQARLAIQKYMRDHPEELHKAAHAIAITALQAKTILAR